MAAKVGVTTRVPDVFTVSVHAPDVVQLVAVGEDQVRVAVVPTSMEAGATETSTGRFTPSPTSSLNTAPSLDVRVGVA